MTAKAPPRNRGGAFAVTEILCLGTTGNLASGNYSAVRLHSVLRNASTTSRAWIGEPANPNAMPI